MLRNPRYEEDEYNYFVGFNEEGNAFLLLPTAKGLLEANYIFALSLVQNKEKKYIYELDTKVTAVDLNDLYEFHDDLAFFFGPNHNLLKKFLNSKGYKTYVSWIQSRRVKQIDELLSQFSQAKNTTKREQLTERLKRFIEA
jgi:hypothetical protein